MGLVRARYGRWWRRWHQGRATPHPSVQHWASHCFGAPDDTGLPAEFEAKAAARAAAMVELLHALIPNGNGHRAGVALQLLSSYVELVVNAFVVADPGEANNMRGGEQGRVPSFLTACFGL